jgi:RND family efflux transporter MFP subunit
MHRVTILAFVAAGGLGCGRGHSVPSSQRTAGPPPRPVRTALVEVQGGAGTTAVPAAVQARQSATLAARIPASVVELPWREGDRVSAGAVVARLDDAALRSSLSAAEAAARTAGVDLQRMETLLKKGAATPKEADEARARAAAADAAVAGARDSLAYAVLRAPFDGTLAARPARVGDVVSPGAAIVVIEGRDGLELRATLESDLVARLRPGLVVEAVVDGQPGPVAATIRAVSAAGDPATHRFEVRADLAPAEGLRSGLFARLVVPSSGTGPRLVVPASAVFARGGLSGVFVVADGRARLRWVAVGATTGSLAEIRAGVAGGERVALEPAGLDDGQPVAEETAGAR